MTTVAPEKPVDARTALQVRVTRLEQAVRDLCLVMRQCEPRGVTKLLGQPGNLRRNDQYPGFIDMGALADIIEGS